MSRQTIRYQAGIGSVVLHDVPVHHCARCGEHEITLSRAPKLRTEVAIAIARKRDKLEAREIRFLREYLGLSKDELADTVGVAPEIAARWELAEEHEVMGTQAERLLRVLVITGKTLPADQA